MVYLFLEFLVCVCEILISYRFSIPSLHANLSQHFLVTWPAQVSRWFFIGLRGFVLQKRLQLPPQIFDVLLVLNLLPSLQIDFSQILILFRLPLLSLLLESRLEFFLLFYQLLVLLLQLFVVFIFLLQSLPQLIILELQFLIQVELTPILLQ